MGNEDLQASIDREEKLERYKTKILFFMYTLIAAAASTNEKGLVFTWLLFAILLIFTIKTFYIYGKIRYWIATALMAWCLPVAMWLLTSYIFNSFHVAGFLAFMLILPLFYRLILRMNIILSSKSTGDFRNL